MVLMAIVMGVAGIEQREAGRPVFWLLGDTNQGVPWQIALPFILTGVPLK